MELQASMAVARILVVGSGGRENALAWALSRSKGNPQCGRNDCSN
ncbi:MAG: hypothetical protein EB119_02450 [Synechococcaceae bacterium WBB_34_004]|nr:hypothetical protein [Synechococcaceae bacterium WBB_34_004]